MLESWSRTYTEICKSALVYLQTNSVTQEAHFTDFLVFAFLREIWFPRSRNIWPSAKSFPHEKKFFLNQLRNIIHRIFFFWPNLKILFSTFFLAVTHKIDYWPDNYEKVYSSCLFEFNKYPVVLFFLKSYIIDVLQSFNSLNDQVAIFAE